MPLLIDPDGDYIPFAGRDAAGNAVPLNIGADGQLLVGLAGMASPWASEGTKTDTTDLVLAAARGAGIRNYLTDFTVSNTSAAAVVVVVKDGSTVIWRGSVPPASTLINNLSRPLRTAANTALAAAALTATTSVIVSASGYTGA